MGHRFNSKQLSRDLDSSLFARYLLPKLSCIELTNMTSPSIENIESLDVHKVTALWFFPTFSSSVWRKFAEEVLFFLFWVTLEGNIYSFWKDDLSNNLK